MCRSLRMSTHHGPPDFEKQNMVQQSFKESMSIDKRAAQQDTAVKNHVALIRGLANAKCGRFP